MPSETTITTALISAGVSIVVAFLTARWQYQSKLAELTQTQFKDVVAKRIEVYPHLWRIAQTMLSDWDRDNKPTDEAWARTLYASLQAWHADYGIFLSQGAYSAFAKLRNEAASVVRCCDKKQNPTKDDLGSYKSTVLGVMSP